MEAPAYWGHSLKASIETNLARAKKLLPSTDFNALTATTGWQEAHWATRASWGQSAGNTQVLPCIQWTCTSTPPVEVAASIQD
mmetsp:Transcript_3087/g.4945  ORF Transcript_3087/g.4945 Transcript_3087/m.4945 type:complete len:83 (-) Transcript_3087:175-423(-)